MRICTLGDLLLQRLSRYVFLCSKQSSQAMFNICWQTLAIRFSLAHLHALMRKNSVVDDEDVLYGTEFEEVTYSNLKAFLHFI